MGMDRQAYHRSIFCDKRLQPLRASPVRVGVPDLVAAGRDAAATFDMQFIFHVAHCGSTLLARALDLPSENLVIREPMALRQLAVEKAGGSASGDWPMRLDLVMQMLSRRYAPHAPVVVKANVPVNFMLPDILGRLSDPRAIFLYFPLEDYLAAILRTPNHRAWVLNVSRELAGAIGGEDLPPPLAAARLWLAQMRSFVDALQRWPGARTLDAETLFSSPHEALAAAFAYLGKPRSEADIAAVVASDLFGRYSKNPAVVFDNAARVARRERLQLELVEELSAARRWLEPRLNDHPLPERLARALTGSSPALL